MTSPHDPQRTGAIGPILNHCASGDGTDKALLSRFEARALVFRPAAAVKRQPHISRFARTQYGAFSPAPSQRFGDLTWAGVVYAPLSDGLGGHNHVVAGTAALRSTTAGGTSRIWNSWNGAKPAAPLSSPGRPEVGTAGWGMRRQRHGIALRLARTTQQKSEPSNDLHEPCDGRRPVAALSRSHCKRSLAADC